MLRGRLAWLVAAAAACGPAPKPGAPGGVAIAVLPDVPFGKLDHDQRVQFMKEHVVPTMAPLFQQHDAEAYADFGCKTCHGDAADRGELHMPNDQLPKLDLADLGDFEQRDLAWMSQVIVPAMAQLLREEQASEQHPEGFGCLRCHAQIPD